MNQAFNTFFQLYKGTIVSDIDNFTFYNWVNRIFLFYTFPWMRFELFETKWDLFLLSIIINNLDFDILTDDKVDEEKDKE